MSNTCLWIAAPIALALTFGCKSKEAAESKPAESKPADQKPADQKPADQKPADPAAAGTVPADQLGTFTCRNIQNDVCVGRTDHFEADVPVVNVTYKTLDLPKLKDIFVIQWIAEDVGQATPPNTVIGTINEEVTELPDGLKNYVVNSHLTRPTKGWPVGKYRVEIKHGDTLATTAHFTIQ